MHFKGLRFALGTTILATGALGLTSQAIAQDQARAEGVEEVIVTATRREQSLQEVPIAVAAYSEEMLQNAGVDDIQEIMNLSPSFQASTNLSESQGLVIRIRGIGTQGNNPAFESAVGVFIDGVYRARAGIALSEMLDIDRIEVLRGPQGTLFGRNTSAGALNVITQGPTFDPQVKVEASYGSFDEFDMRGSINGGLIKDKLAARISAQYAQRDGLVEDLLTGDDYDTKDRYTVKGQLLFTPTDRTSLRLILDRRGSQEECCYPVTLTHSAAAANANIINFLLNPGTQINPADPFGRKATMTPGRSLAQNVGDWGLSGELNIERDNFTITSITSYRDFESYRAADIDFTDADLLYNTRKDTNRIFTQEIRVQGEAGKLDWLVGAFYSNEDISLRGSVVHGRQYEDYLNARTGAFINPVFGASLGPLMDSLGVPRNWSGLAAAGSYLASGGTSFLMPGEGWASGTGAIDDYFTSDNKSFSIFTHNVYSLTDDLKAIVGFRYNWDDKHAVSDLNLDPANTPGCLAVRPFIQAFPNHVTMEAFGFTGDIRRAKDVLAVFSCLGIASPAFNYDLTTDTNEWSGVLGLQYQANDDLMVYGSASRGYKDGGINLDRAGTILGLVGDNTDPLNFLSPVFFPELVWAYELGMKKSFPDQRMTVNLAVYYHDIDNFQLNTFTGFNFTPENVENAKTRGFELEVNANPTAGLNVMLGLAYTKADYGDSITDLTNTLINARGLRDTVVGGMVVASAVDLPELSSLAGQQLTNAPRWTFTGALTYAKPIYSGDVEVFMHTDWRYSSKFNTGSDLDIEKLQESFILFNARGGVRSADGVWAVELWAKNLFDKDYQQIAFDIPLQSNDGWGTFLADPRTWGITVRGRF